VDEPEPPVGVVFGYHASTRQPNAKVQPRAAPTQLSPVPERGAACRLQRTVRPFLRPGGDPDGFLVIHGHRETIDQAGRELPPLKVIGHPPVQFNTARTGE
jgi:hypothetical protein